MKVTSKDTRAEIVRWVDITEDHPVVPAAYFDPPKNVRVEHVSITYTWIDGSWKAIGADHVTLRGTVLKKDGTPGKADHRRRPKTRSWTDRTYAPEFAWLYPVIDLLRPSGDVSMAVPDEAEVEA
jgi:hypothetical protein